MPLGWICLGLSSNISFGAPTATPNAGTPAPPPPIVTAEPPALSLAPPPLAPPAPTTPAPAPPAPAPMAAAAPAAPSEEITVAEEETMPGSGYVLIPPAFALDLSFSPSALGGKDVSGGSQVKTKGVSLGFEYQPKSLQSIGILGFGPSFNLYPILPARPDIQSTPYTIQSFGGTIRYQARYFREQLIVPEVAYEFARLSARTLAGSSGPLTLTGPEGGIYILLNRLEPSSAFDFYRDDGALRTYLTAEVRALSGSNSSLAISGSSYYFGLRVEF